MSNASASETELEFAAAGTSEWPEIARLLQQGQLPLAGAREHLRSFMVCRAGSDVVATGGLELYEDVALLRSVAVASTYRSRGIGRALVDALVERAWAHGAQQVALLTTTAERYFERQGFVIVSRASLPGALSASAEFQGACPERATAMVKHRPEQFTTRTI